MNHLKKLKQKLCPIERRQLIVDAAIEVIKEEGVALLTMEKVVARVPYSKGTVYNHFTCKEDLLTAVGNRAVTTLLGLFKKAATYQGNTRERMLAINLSYLLYVSLHPHFYQSMLSIKSPTVFAKASSCTREKHDKLEAELLEMFDSLTQQAIDNKELINPDNLRLCQISFMMFAMNFGTVALLGSNLESCNFGHEMEVAREYFNHTNIVLDGLGWQPLRAEFNYRQTARNILSQIFSEEVAELAKRGQIIML